MSQYGAAGYALHGASYQEILRDYYAQTTLGHVRPEPARDRAAAGPRARAIVQRGDGHQGLVGAQAQPAFNYSVQRAGAKLRVMLGRHLIGNFSRSAAGHRPGDR